MNLQQVESILTTMQADYTRQFGARELLLDQLRETENELNQAKDDITNWEAEKLLLSEASEYARRQTVAHIEQVTTAGLQTVFTEEEHVGFKVKITDYAQGTPAAYWLITDKSGEHDIEHPPEEDGGGAADVVSLALRSAMLEMFRAEGQVFFDESGKHVDVKHIKNFAYFIEQYAEKTGRQVFNITHQAAVADIADVAYEIRKHDGISEAVRL
ncbi:hypothetical protein [Phosphitispora fastidiosa]|uniref:hypothetical protein n=1 Tax=Phosphitispora fastidiosa TaxID=2837202 RepID=UPI001E4C7838|nr:hypothetical protein [Phosphitispora fastidiosa]MBU7006345.1 DNA repair ATPase RecN [Phosphitispora fastidiosa]